MENELRLGNYMNYRFYNPLPNNPTWETQKVTIVGILKTQLYFKFDNDNSVKKIKELEPIQLTEEWLLKFGFKLNHNQRWYGLDGFYMRKIDDKFETEVGECSYKTIDYVHQLQNLYFALNDEELTMK
jgi:hypothetical protein